MNRRDVLNWIKSEVCPKLDLTQELDIEATIKAVERHRVSTHFKASEPMTAEINEYGHLFINGDHAGQVTNKIPRPTFSEESYYVESLILARQGV